MFKIEGGRSSFWQWDLNQRLIVGDDICGEVHFCNRTGDCALVCRVYEDGGKKVVDVPNILLQTTNSIHVYAYAVNGDAKCTKKKAYFLVLARTKPSDYIYTETELYTVEEMVEEALQAAKESGDFKGEKGDKGDAGSVKFLVVAELPTDGIDESAIYLVPTADPKEQNTYSEYIFTNGAWECIGSASVEVNLDEYVKTTDYASSTKAGVAKVHGSYGIYMRDNTLTVQCASGVEIAKKYNSMKPIVPSELDAAIKAGMVNNQMKWTEEEKASARDMIGAVEKPANPPRTSVLSMQGDGTIRTTQLVHESATPWSVPSRDGSGGVVVANPTLPEHATSKQYVDNAIANAGGGGSGGDSNLRLIREITLTEDTYTIDVNTDSDGNPFELTEVVIYGMTQGTASLGQLIISSCESTESKYCLLKVSSFRGLDTSRRFWFANFSYLGTSGRWVRGYNDPDTSAEKSTLYYQYNCDGWTNTNGLYKSTYEFLDKLTHIRITSNTSGNNFATGSTLRIYGR